MKVAFGEIIDFMTRRVLPVAILTTTSAMKGAVNMSLKGVTWGIGDMGKVYAEVSKMTLVGVSTLRNILDSANGEHGRVYIDMPGRNQRGRGSDYYNREGLRKLTPWHLNAITEFIYWQP